MFRFTIRDVLWLTVVVALAVSWWLHAGRMQLASKANEIAAKRSAAEARTKAVENAALMQSNVALEAKMEARIKAFTQEFQELRWRIEDAGRVERLRGQGYLPAHAAPIQPQPKALAKAGE